MSRKQKVTLALTITVLVMVIAFSWAGWNSTKQDLGLARTELANTQAAAKSKENELSLTKDELQIVNNKLQATKDSLLNLEIELQATKDSLLNLETELQATKDSLLNLETELQATKAKLSAIQTDALHLHNPTFEEVISFLREDKTDANEYVKHKYTCLNFTSDVNNNAESRGIRCGYVCLYFPEQSHAIIAFDTVDYGMVYFESQTDERATPVIGWEYWRQCVQPYYYYEKPSDYDDTIQDILVVW